MLQTLTDLFLLWIRADKKATKGYYKAINEFVSSVPMNHDVRIEMETKNKRQSR